MSFRGGGAGLANWMRILGKGARLPEEFGRGKDRWDIVAAKHQVPVLTGQAAHGGARRQQMAGARWQAFLRSQLAVGPPLWCQLLPMSTLLFLLLVLFLIFLSPYFCFYFLISLARGVGDRKGTLCLWYISWVVGDRSQPNTLRTERLRCSAVVWIMKISHRPPCASYSPGQRVVTWSLFCSIPDGCSFFRFFFSFPSLFFLFLSFLLLLQNIQQPERFQSNKNSMETMEDINGGH